MVNGGGVGIGRSPTSSYLLDVNGNTLINGILNISSSGAYRVSGTTVIDSSRNLTNIGTISSGAITSTGNMSLSNTGTGNNITISRTDSSTSAVFHIGSSRGYVGTTTDHVFEIRQNDTPAITIDTSGDTTVENNLVADGHFTFSSSNHRWTAASSGAANNILGKIGTTGAAGIALKDSANVFRIQIYGEGSTYGFLASEWGGWDLKKTTSGKLTFNGNDTYFLQPEHANSAKFRSYVQIGDSSSYNSNSGSWGARLNVTDDVHAKIEVGQDANSMLSHWYAHTGHTSIKFGTSSSHDVELQRAGSTLLELEPGGLMTMVPIRRNSHHASGFLEGSYNNIGSANNAASNPIYTIGSSYNPAQTTLSNMYGIGFTKKGNASFLEISVNLDGVCTLLLMGMLVFS